MLTLNSGSTALLLGAAFSALAAAAHVACVIIGPAAYRVMGAGERMARAAEAKQLRPSLVTLALAAILFLWAAYALSGAGIGPTLPLTRWALVAISAIYLARAVAAPFLQSRFPENSKTFWIVSSGICGIIGLAYAYGTVALWSTW